MSVGRPKGSTSANPMRKRISVRASEDGHEHLERWAARRGESLTALVRAALRYADEHMPDSYRG